MKKLVTTIVKYDDFVDAFETFLKSEIGDVKVFRESNRIIFVLKNKREIFLDVLRKVKNDFSDFAVIKIVLNGFSLEESKVIENFIQHISRILQA